ncbi:efflux RND transporter permease subunit [Synechococcus sp. PCC 7336]|uniref:efflux RND transporter permease subunit n=1 Tax=Synechococcus sp. PCC 7336 TaxID=195250 RepID=UPI00034922E2|nr:efflux RND transporter permease subunit [Synechococcus sp. PCC 7336]
MILFVNAFIKRPVLTTVCSILIVLLGAVGLLFLPIQQLPEIAPPQITVDSLFIGADAQTVETTVTTPLEREINGVEGMRYISSQSNNDGTSQIVVTFEPSRDKDLATVDVQNKVSTAQSDLPSEVLQTGITVQAASTNILLAYAFYPETDQFDETFVSNYLDLFVLDEIRRIPGVGRADILGERKYAMRLWLDPNKMAGRGLAAQDVVAALQEQNIQVSAGQVGLPPSPQGQEFQISLRARGRLESQEEFENLVIATGEAGNLVKLRDVGRAELGAEDYQIAVDFNDRPAVFFAVYQLPGSNALAVAQAVKAKMEELSQAFPSGVQGTLAYDTTKFVEVSLAEVISNLVQAIVLVVLAIFVFLQDWRTTLIPAVAIPVALLGACAMLFAVGFSANTLTLFAFILATGLVVDDGIVVVEAVSVKISQGMRPRQAAMDAMKELTGAIVATSLVLMAVFIPVSLLPGSTGIVYRQFALTIVFAILFSTFNALTFSPTMSALLLQANQETNGSGLLGRLFDRFNRGFSWIIDRYRGLMGNLNRAKALVMVAFVGGLALMVWMYQIVPTGFIPEEDQGYVLVVGRAPEGVSLDYTRNLASQIYEVTQDFPEVATFSGLSGFGFDGRGSNQITGFITLKDWSERKQPQQSAFALLDRLNGRLSEITDGIVLAVNAPPVPGLSSTGGFEFQLQDRTGTLTSQEFLGVARDVIDVANDGNPNLSGVFTQYSANTPQFLVEVDRERAKALNVNVDDIFSTLQIYLGSAFVNQFTLGQRQYRVYVQAESEFRSDPADIDQLYVRSTTGSLVPLDNLVRREAIVGPQSINHYNLFRSIKLQGSPAAGKSSGQAIQAMEETFERATIPGVTFEWTTTALEEVRAGGLVVYVFLLGIIVVFLVLAAQYESYVDPIIILLTVPLAILGALVAVWLRANLLGTNITNDIYCQVGLVMLIALASKNTILIVDFANQEVAKGLSIPQAALRAGELRFRPILMTAFSTLVGFLPLLTASGAGSVSRWSLGTAVFGGMLVATVLSLFFAPILYIVIKQLAQSFSGGQPAPPSDRPKNGKGDITGWLRSLLPHSGDRELASTPPHASGNGASSQSFTADREDKSSV